MITREELHAVLKDVFSESGFTKQGQQWARRTNELLWLVHLDRSPLGERYRLDIGIALLLRLEGAEPSRENDCPISVAL